MSRTVRTISLFTAGVLLLLLSNWLGARGFAVTYRWHGLVFWAGVLSLLNAGIAFVSHLRKKDRGSLNTMFISVSICLMFLELAVRIAGFETTYVEKRMGWYQSSYQQNLEDPMRVHRHYQEFLMHTPEYRFHRTVNSHGFADEEFLPKKKGEVLIQTYGDSFTEGDGAPADSSYPALLRGMFIGQGRSDVKVQNFGFSGNDPGFYWRQLRDVGVLMNPDIVVIAYGSLDMTVDFFTRGGLERFHDTRWSSINGPWWEFIYANSHFSRWVVRVCCGISVRSFLTTPSQQELRLRELEPKWNSVFDSIASLSERHGFQVLLVKKPERSEIDRAVYEYDFSFFDEFLVGGKPFHHLDLLDHYLNDRGLTADSTARYYWVNDGHHNPIGYHLMAGAVFVGLQREFESILRPQTDP
jgi:hypothetical protein